MRKAILGLVVVLAVAGIAAAQPSGTGGTLYFSSYDQAAGQMRYYYLDVNSDWSKIGSLTGFATVNSPEGPVYNYPGPQNNTNGTPALRTYVAPNATTGLQNETSLHGGVLLQGVVGGFVGVNSDGTTTQLNNTQIGDGMIALVGPGTTPDGGYGVWQQSNGVNTTWKGTFTAGGMNTQSTNPTPQMMNSPLAVGNYDPLGYEYSIWSAAANQYAGNNYQVNGHKVSGMIVSYNQQTQTTNFGSFKVAYKDASDANYQTLYFAGNLVPTAMGVGDTDGNGIPDVYLAGGFTISRQQDLNGDGNFGNDGFVDTTVPAVWGSMRLAQVGAADALFPGGHWVILNYQDDFSASGAFVRVYGLDSAGNWDNTSAEIINTFTDGSLHLPSNGNTNVTSYDTNGQPVGFENRAYATDINFVPLGSAQVEVPEPATMLLVGTGVLGLAGVLRRRLIS